MAQLDRFLNLLVTNNAIALVLSEGEVATVIIKDSPRPVMKQALTSAQILTLVREIAPGNQPHAPDPKGNVRFEYVSADGAFDVTAHAERQDRPRGMAPKSAATSGTNQTAPRRSQAGRRALLLQ